MFTKLLHLAKMTWMFTWRLLVIDAILFKGKTDDKALLIGFILAAVLIFVFNKTLLTWPLVRLIRRKRVIIPANGWGSDAAVPPETPKKEPAPTPVPTTKFRDPKLEGEMLAGAIENGRITGYEPSTLENQPVPDAIMMTGVPGSGLHGAAGLEEGNIELGVQGEENFARALSVAGLINRFATVWSVPVLDPFEYKLNRYLTDIDCVLATDDTVFLVDLKNYKSGAVRYHHKGNILYCEDTMTGQQVGEMKSMSRNMAMATSALRTHFPEVNFTPVVVFMPTDKGEGFIDNVVWPDNIPAMNLSQFLFKLKTEPNFDWKTTVHAGVVARIGNLLNLKRD